MRMVISSAVLAAALVAGGCGGGPRYEDNRPPVDATVDGNTGLQAKDVGSATDMMVTSLLSSPDLNASAQQWTIVLSKVENNTGDPGYDYNVFVTRLKSLIAQKGRGRVTLIENKERFHKLQNQELEQPADNMGQGGGGSANPPGIQPQFDLYITIDRMPNRATDYYVINATCTNLQTRGTTWVSPQYEVQTAR